ncbi:hypothetical protein WKC53_12525 [Morganella morganii]|uniref:hypothetical protein n=1 Tax=Morganella morganii TaxID=582 RepID=UPI0030FEF813
MQPHKKSDSVTYPHSPLVAYGSTYMLRIIAGALSVSGILFTGLSLLRMRSAVLSNGMPLILLGSLLIFSGEILSRFAFFIVG